MKKITMLAALVAFLAVVGCGGTTTPASSPASKPATAPTGGKMEEKKPEEKKPEEKKTETPAPEKK